MCRSSVERTNKGEAQGSHALRGTGTPSPAEEEYSQITHMPFRSRRPACVHGKARDQHHRRRDQYEKGLTEVGVRQLLLECGGRGGDNRDPGGEGLKDQDGFCPHSAREKRIVRVRS